MKPGAEQLDPRSADPQIYYLHVTLSVPRQNHRPFVTLMERLLSVIHDLYGWEFVHGSYPISGKVNQFVHVWKIPDPADVLHIMRHGAFNHKAAMLPSRGKNEKDSASYKYFRAIYWELQGLVTETKHALTTALPADPNYEGFQSHTILIERGDDKPRWFLIDHDEMKEAWKELDLRACVDALQFFERRRRWASEDPPEPVPNPDTEQKPKETFPNRAEWTANEEFRQLKGRLQQREVEASGVGNPAEAARDTKFGPYEAGKVDWTAIAKIRELLNFGATNATVKSPLLAEQQPYTLVNLSALKPRSVQQEGYMPPEEALEVVGMSPVDGTTDNLLVVAPWGSIYCANGEALGKVLRTVNFDGDGEMGKKAKKHTEERIAAFTQGQVSIGSILEPRENQIGDGCACYVINLNAIPKASR